jgi:hypothetical protein
MSGIKNTIQKFANASMGKGFKTSEQVRRPEEEMKRKQRRDKMYANAEMPDEELVKRNERRKMARRGGSRADTVLTNKLGSSDTLG